MLFFREWSGSYQDHFTESKSILTFSRSENTYNYILRFSYWACKLFKLRFAKNMYKHGSLVLKNISSSAILRRQLFRSFEFWIFLRIADHCSIAYFKIVTGIPKNRKWPKSRNSIIHKSCLVIPNLTLACDCAYDPVTVALWLWP